jgi:hypothetical protein
MALTTEVAYDGLAFSWRRRRRVSAFNGGGGGWWLPHSTATRTRTAALLSALQYPQPPHFAKKPREKQ